MSDKGQHPTARGDSVTFGLPQYDATQGCITQQLVVGDRGRPFRVTCLVGDEVLALVPGAVPTTDRLALYLQVEALARRLLLSKLGRGDWVEAKLPQLVLALRAEECDFSRRG